VNDISSFTTLIKTLSSIIKDLIVEGFLIGSIKLLKCCLERSLSTLFNV